jgi:hypothetical protein
MTMKAKNLAISIWLLATALGAAVAQSQPVEVTLLNANQTVTQGTASVAFDATLLNTSASETIFLNSDNWCTACYLTIDDSGFYANAPLSLSPGQSTSPFELFAVDLSPTIPPGTYQDTFSILGGPDGGTYTDFNVVGTAPFSITVNSAGSGTSVPEPGSLPIMLAGILALVWARARPGLRPRPRRS